MPSPMIGEIRMFAFSRTPLDWLPCDGSLKRIQDYDALFVLLGTTYGGDGAETFGLPDMRGRVPVHQGKGVATSGALTQRYLGVRGGSETVTLLAAHIPAHTHPFSVSNDFANATDPEGALLSRISGDNLYVAPDQIGTSAAGATAADTLSAAGGSVAHENTMPTLTMSYCICARGFFPSKS